MDVLHLRDLSTSNYNAKENLKRISWIRCVHIATSHSKKNVCSVRRWNRNDMFRTSIFLYYCHKQINFQFLFASFGFVFYNKLCNVRWHYTFTLCFYSCSWKGLKCVFSFHIWYNWMSWICLSDLLVLNKYFLNLLCIHYWWGLFLFYGWWFVFLLTLLNEFLSFWNLY